MKNLKPVDGQREGIEFVAYDKFDTDYQTTEIGKITRGQRTSGEISGSVGPSGGAVPAGATAKATAEETITEEAVQRHRRINRAVRFTNDMKEACIIQEGEFGIDLTGNFSVDFRIKVPEKELQVVKSFTLKKDNKPGSSMEGHLEFVSLKYPDFYEDMKLDQNLKCDISYKFLIRHVEGDGHREYVEGYHDVVSWPGSGASPPLSLVAAKDLKTRVFVLKTNDDRYVLCEGEETFDEPKRLSFLSYQDAVRFLK